MNVQSVKRLCVYSFVLKMRVSKSIFEKTYTMALSIDRVTFENFSRSCIGQLNGMRTYLRSLSGKRRGAGETAQF